MNQMFFGNARIMLFDAGSQPPTPTTRMTKFTFIDGTYDEVLVEGELNEIWFTQHNYYSGGTWLKKIISIELGENATVEESALEGLDLAPVYGENGQRFSKWTIFRINEDVTAQVQQPKWDEVIEAWDTGSACVEGDSNSTFGYAQSGQTSEDNVAINWTAQIDSWMTEVLYTATRTENNIIGYTHRKTLYKYEGDTEWKTVMLDGTIQLFDYGSPTGQIENAEDIVAVEIGTGTQANPVTRIADTAFSGCTKLISVTMPDSITSFGEMIFNGCTLLANVNISNSVTVIPHGMFMMCESLTSISIPNTVTIIESSAFGNCTNLTSMTIPNGVTSIGEWAFYNCSGLTNVTIPDSVTEIGNQAFLDCSGLTSVTIVATGKPGASAESVKQMMIDTGRVDPNITWNGVD